MTPTKAHCNNCGGERNHEVLHTEASSWSDDSDYSRQYYGTDRYETLKCLGCENIKLRHTSTFSELDEPNISYFPPAIFRPQPKWLNDLWLELPFDDKFIGALIREIYVALHNNLPSLAAMGVRSLLETVMISKTGDHGNFVKNMAEFESQGYVSRIQRERLEAILEAGHAAIHRSFSPSTSDVVTLVDIAEHIIETVYLHENKVKELKKRVPPRTAKALKKAPKST